MAIRELVTSTTIKDIEKKITRMESRGWTRISDIKIDDSSTEVFNDFRYVAVMEHPSLPNTGRKWGQRYHMS